MLHRPCKSGKSAAVELLWVTMAVNNIILAFPKAETGKKIKNILIRSGYYVASVVTSGGQVLNDAQTLQYGVVITGFRLPDMMFRDLKEDLPQGFRMIVLTSRAQWDSYGDPEVVNLATPLQVHDLLATLDMVLDRVEHYRKKQRMKPRVRSEQEERLIRQAKSLLMERNNMTEEEAHRYLQKTSMDDGISFTETAEKILSLMDRS